MGDTTASGEKTSRGPGNIDAMTETDRGNAAHKSAKKPWDGISSSSSWLEDSGQNGGPTSNPDSPLVLTVCIAAQQPLPQLCPSSLPGEEAPGEWR